jgi:transcriptional regulator with XRE-family HTH domain
MVMSGDFSWAEVGARVRDRRLRLGMSQQTLSAISGVTQNGVSRIETGATNPQLSTLRNVAEALDCSVRDLIVGSSDTEPALVERLGRIRRILESGDQRALRAIDFGMETAEALLERSAIQRRRRNTGSILVVKPEKALSEADPQGPTKAAQKGHEGFRDSTTNHEPRHSRVADKYTVMRRTSGQTLIQPSGHENLRRAKSQ